MNILERVAYLKGLVKGLEIDESQKEGKVLLAMLEVLDEMALTINDLEENQDEIQELVDIIDEDLGEIEEDFYGEDDDDDEDYEDDDEDFCDCVNCVSGGLFELECPSCNEVITLDEQTVEKGEIECPGCGETLELEIEEIDDQDEDEQDK